MSGRCPRCGAAVTSAFCPSCGLYLRAARAAIPAPALRRRLLPLIVPLAFALAGVLVLARFSSLALVAELLLLMAVASLAWWLLLSIPYGRREYPDARPLLRAGERVAATLMVPGAFLVVTDRRVLIVRGRLRKKSAAIGLEGCSLALEHGRPRPPASSLGAAASISAIWVWLIREARALGTAPAWLLAALWLLVVVSLIAVPARSWRLVFSSSSGRVEVALPESMLGGQLSEYFLDFVDAALAAIDEGWLTSGARGR